MVFITNRADLRYRALHPLPPVLAAELVFTVRADRLDFRPRHRLTVLVVQACALSEPIVLPREPEYAGCTSWVELPVAAQRKRPVHDHAALAAVARRVHDAVG